MHPSTIFFPPFGLYLLTSILTYLLVSRHEHGSIDDMDLELYVKGQLQLPRGIFSFALVRMLTTPLQQETQKQSGLCNTHFKNNLQSHSGLLQRVKQVKHPGFFYLLVFAFFHMWCTDHGLRIPLTQTCSKANVKRKREGEVHLFLLMP